MSHTRLAYFKKVNHEVSKVASPVAGEHRRATHKSSCSQDRCLGACVRARCWAGARRAEGWHALCLGEQETQMVSGCEDKHGDSTGKAHRPEAVQTHHPCQELEASGRGARGRIRGWRTNV